MKCTDCYSEIAETIERCPNCGSEVKKTETKGQGDVTTAINTTTLLLTDMSSRDEIIIDRSGIIGREGDFALDYFKGCDYISRLHCEVTTTNNGFMIEHLPTAKHPTKLDNITLSVRVPRAIRDRSILTIADKNYRVSINTKSTQDDISQSKEVKQDQSPQDIITSDTEQNNQLYTPTSEEKYEILCRKCGTVHDVPSEDTIIKECNGCEDEYDKHDIAKVRARRIDAN